MCQCICMQMLETPEKLPHDIVESVVDMCNKKTLDIMLYKYTLFAFLSFFFNARGWAQNPKKKNP